MQTMRESWTDERLDDLSGRVSDGFDRVEDQVHRVEGQVHRVEDQVRDLRGEMNARFEKVDERFDKVEAKFNAKFDCVDDQLGSIQRAIILLAVTLTGSMIAGFAAMIALFATQF